MSEDNENMAPMNNEKDNLVSEEQEVTQETAGNKNENQDASRNQIVEKMLEEVLEKQKNFERIHENMLKEVVEKQKIFETSLVDELRSVKSELQLIRDDLKPKTVTASVPVKRDIENTTDSDSKNESATMPTTGKYFVLKHVFENVSSLKENVDQWSEAEEHFGFKCNRSTTSGWSRFIEWSVLKKDFLVDGKLTAEVHIKVGKTSGVYKENLRSFDETMEEFSDVVLVVNEEKFNVSKLYLAAQSSYFKALFLGKFNESEKSEIELTGIDADDFQKYIEVLYGESAIDEFTVEGILMVADMYDTPLVIRKCEEFLLEKSKKSLKKKLQMSMKYHLEALNKQCRKEIKSVADIKSVLPGDIRDLDPSITTEFLEIALSIQ
ncbi:hypothetical protein GCK72_006858 [Caenorhabditis remanei]|uniref:BTB domain-containing protein n=1 Tax=Caenorhabditis remanei TaxID=31234 RepID=A0A6A5HG17_CAERE|nr:hypothetical protein GCK72_006858 [Caenorhabditis remanei]KAF1766900.1 hypothetical protein GCK72_006858 [Caenorhabditis remanei]